MVVVVVAAEDVACLQTLLLRDLAVAAVEVAVVAAAKGDRYHSCTLS